MMSEYRRRPRTLQAWPRETIGRGRGRFATVQPSAPVILFGLTVSTFTRTARFVCGEKGVEYSFERLGIKPTSKIRLNSDEHLQLHAWGKAPIMQHGELRLIETSAICRYIDA